MKSRVSTEVQEEFSVRQAHTSLIPYRPSRRVEAGGPETMDFCSIESESPLSSSSNRLQKCNRCQKLGHYTYECSPLRPVARNTERCD
uniref:CCHC-type domain-containing protein n=1 Tax=Hyaloperonospora arabidopsidis (strain Emoy2) TaxID=559515 RepID=M4BCJ2_HYAAE